MSGAVCSVGLAHAATAQTARGTGAGVVLASSASEDVPVPGGTDAVAHQLGFPTVPDRGRFAGELARLVIDLHQRKSGALASTLRTLAREPALDTVPIPLTAAVWSDAVFHRRVAPGDVLFAILSDPQAALLCRGLSALDDETLEYLASHPGVVSALYAHNAPAVAAFGAHLRILGQRVVMPGGETAVPLWEAAVGAPVSAPDRFVVALFTMGDGRIAYLFDTIAGLDRAGTAFALGTSIADPARRLDAMHALVTAWTDAYREWRVRSLPFSRAPYDAARLLMRVRADPDGTLAPPRSRSFWSHVFAGDDAPDNPARLLAAPSQRPDGPIDAAWLVAAASAGDAMQRADRLDQLSFGQRVFSAAPASSLPDVLLAVRTLPRYRMLMWTLERTGIRTPALYASSVRLAERLAALNDDRALAATTNIQGALEIVRRLTSVGTLTATQAEALIVRLVAIPLNEDGSFGGAVGRWLRSDLEPLLPPSDSFERALIAGVSGRPQQPAVEWRWEGVDYRVDVPTAERRRMEAVRARQGGPRIDDALDVIAAASALTAPGLTLGGIDAAARRMKAIGAALPPARQDIDGYPPGVSPPRNPRDAILKAAGDLAASAGAHDAARAVHAQPALAQAADELTGQVLTSFVYALSLGDADGAALLAGDISPRHDFGFSARDAGAHTRTRWMLPHQDITPGVVWHVDGSLLGLDVGLAPLTLRRLNSDRPMEAPTLLSNARDTFVQSAVLVNPPTDDAVRDGVVAAVVAGRGVVAALASRPGGADEIADAVAMDGWRRRALRWSVLHDPGHVDSLVSLVELAMLGDPAHPLDPRAWGMPAMISDGCLCSELPGRWAALVGRPQIGLLATSMADLQLSVAERLHDLGVPAALGRYVLSAAVQDFIDEVRPNDGDDWLTLVRAARATSRERVEDYVAAAAADGPLLASQ